MTHRVFCVQCSWHVYAENDKSLWFEHRYCPDCYGCTDAVKVKHKPKGQDETTQKEQDD